MVRTGELTSFFRSHPLPQYAANPTDLAPWGCSVDEFLDRHPNLFVLASPKAFSFTLAQIQGQEAHRDHNPEVRTCKLNLNTYRTSEQINREGNQHQGLDRKMPGNTWVLKGFFSPQRGIPVIHGPGSTLRTLGGYIKHRSATEQIDLAQNRENSPHQAQIWRHICTDAPSRIGSQSQIADLTGGHTLDTLDLEASALEAPKENQSNLFIRSMEGNTICIGIGSWEAIKTLK